MFLAASEMFVRVGMGIVALGALVLWRVKTFDLMDTFLFVVAIGGLVGALLAAEDWLGLVILSAWSAFVAWEAKSARSDEGARVPDSE